MRTVIEHTVDGVEVRIWIPETEADAEELRQRAERGELDDKLAFSDYPREVRDRAAKEPKPQ